MNNYLLWISLPYATFGLEVENGIITDAAPISRLSIGKSVEFVKSYYLKKGAKIEQINPKS